MVWKRCINQVSHYDLPASKLTWYLQVLVVLQFCSPQVAVHSCLTGPETSSCDWHQLCDLQLYQWTVNILSVLLHTHAFSHTLHNVRNDKQWNTLYIKPIGKSSKTARKTYEKWHHLPPHHLNINALLSNITFLQLLFVKRFALCYQSVVCSVLSVTFVHCGQTIGRIKTKLGMQVGLGPGHIVLDGDPAPLP